MENYVRKPKEKAEAPINENEIRIVASNPMKSYVSYALSLLQDKGHSSVVLKAMGRAINKTVAIAEVVKRRVAGLHQITEVSSTDITDVWEPTEAGLSKLEIVRHVSCISIVLSKDAVNTSSPGYQPPLPADQVKPLEGGEEAADPLVVELEARGDGIRDRRRGQGGRGRRGRGSIDGGGEGGSGAAGAAPADGTADAAAEEGAAGGRARGRGGRGRGRGRGGRGRGRGRAGRGGEADAARHIAEAMAEVAI